MLDVLPLFIALTFLAAGFTKGIVGLGLPTIAMGVLGVALKPAEAASLLVVPSLVTNVWQLAAGPSIMPLWRRFWPMMLGIAVGTWAGAGLLTGGGSLQATSALGGALMAYAGLGLAQVHFRVPGAAERFLSPLIGVATGVVTAATGVFVIPAVPYLQALALGTEDLIQALGLSFTVSTLALAAGLTHDGAFRASDAGASLLALLPALAGMWLGQWVRLRVHPEIFRRCFFAGLLALGAYLLLAPRG